MVIGYKLDTYPTNKRVAIVTIDADTLSKFAQVVKQYSVQAVEYKPFLRFFLADCLDKFTEYTLGKTLISILQNSAKGAILLEIEPLDRAMVDVDTDLWVLLATAISHLIGVPNFDAMAGKFYARFSVKNENNSDSYLRQAYRRLELHNDGTYVVETTDWVLMQKLLEQNVDGGDSLLLHVDDWAELDKFYHHPQAKVDVKWGAPVSKNISYNVFHPIFLAEQIAGEVRMSYIDQFAEPHSIEQGLYLHAVSESLEKDTNTSTVKLPVGSMLIINNYRWLHGRDQFMPQKNLHRELLRQRGVFWGNVSKN